MAERMCESASNNLHRIPFAISPPSSATAFPQHGDLLLPSRWQPIGAFAPKRVPPAVAPKPTRTKLQSLGKIAPACAHEKLTACRSAPLNSGETTGSELTGKGTVDVKVSVARLRNAFIQPISAPRSSRLELDTQISKLKVERHQSLSAHLPLPSRPTRPITSWDDEITNKSSESNLADHEHVPLACVTKTRPKMTKRRAPSCLPTSGNTSNPSDSRLLPAPVTKSAGTSVQGKAKNTAKETRAVETIARDDLSAMRKAVRGAGNACQTNEYRPRGKLAEVYV